MNSRDLPKATMELLSDAFSISRKALMDSRELVLSEADEEMAFRIFQEQRDAQARRLEKEIPRKELEKIVEMAMGPAEDIEKIPTFDLAQCLIGEMVHRSILVPPELVKVLASFIKSLEGSGAEVRMGIREVSDHPLMQQPSLN